MITSTPGQAIRPVTCEETVESGPVVPGTRAHMGDVLVTARWYNVHTMGLDASADDSGSDGELDYPALWWVADE